MLPDALAGWGQWLMGPKGSKESAHLKITLSVHLRHELVCRSAGESEAGNYFRTAGVDFRGWACGTDAEVMAVTPGPGLGLEFTREARSQRVRSPSRGQMTRNGTRGQKPGSRMKNRVKDRFR